MNRFYVVILSAFVYLMMFGCSPADSTEIITKSSGEAEASDETPIEDFWEASAPREDLAVNETEETAPIDLRFVIKSGQEQRYRLTNDILTIAQSPDDPNMKEETTSYLNADQSISVDDSQTFFIQTTGVEGAVEGEGMTLALANQYMNATVKAIEGSMLVAAYDEKGSGKNIRLIGDGIGLNPLGAQAGSQDAVIGFMGVLLPGGTVEVGETWMGEYDMEETAREVFNDTAVRTSDGKIPLTYKLKSYDKEKGLAQIEITGTGNSIVNVPMGTAMVQIQMKVDIDGDAFVRLSDGWLEELRVRTDVLTQGLVATKQTVRTITKLVK